MTSELDILRKISFGSLSEAQLLDIYYQYKDKYRVLMHLAMQPRFPVKYSLDVIPRLFAADLIRVIKNKRTPAEIRKKAELDFFYRYPKFPLGEKLGYMKVAPASLIEYFVEEKDKRVLEAMLKNPLCTEAVVLKFITRKSHRFEVYDVLLETQWFKRPMIAEALAVDPETPIRLMIEIIPLVSRGTLKKIFENSDTHSIVRNNITQYLNERIEIKGK